MLTSFRQSIILLKDSPPTSPHRLPITIVPPKTTNPASGCQVDVNPLSLGPRSADLIHTYECCCSRGRGYTFIINYIMKWVAYRIDKLGNSPLPALGWARLTCAMLDIESEELERRLQYAED